MATPSKTALRKTVGRGKFTVNDYAERTGVTRRTALNHLQAAAEAEAVEVVGQTSTGKRGRPARVYKVAAGR